MKRDFSTDDVAAVYRAWPDNLRKHVLRIRTMIFEVAEKTQGVGILFETLKWGVPAYLTQRPKSGTTIRLESKSKKEQYGLYVSCSTTLIEQCRQLYPDTFAFDKNRGLVFGLNDLVPEDELRHFIAMALTYHVKSGPDAQQTPATRGFARK